MGLILESGSNIANMGLILEGNQTARVVDIAGHRAVEIKLSHYGDADPMRTEPQPNPLPEPYVTNGIW